MKTFGRAYLVGIGKGKRMSSFQSVGPLPHLHLSPSLLEFLLPGAVTPVILCWAASSPGSPWLSSLPGPTSPAETVLTWQALRVATFCLAWRNQTARSHRDWSGGGQGKEQTGAQQETGRWQVEQTGK